MDLRFYLDPETGEPHIDEHGVSEEEVVVYVPDPGRRSAFVVTAYDLRGKALAAYRRRRRRKR